MQLMEAAQAKLVIVGSTNEEVVSHKDIRNLFSIPVGTTSSMHFM
jgi:hypothetical protein